MDMQTLSDRSVTPGVMVHAVVEVLQMSSRDTCDPALQ